MTPHRRLFSAYGVELEYMIVDGETLDVLPVAHPLLQQSGIDAEGEVSRDQCSWSNELVAHVIEIKTNGPTRDLDRLARPFQKEVDEINRRLQAHGGRLLGTGAHPWMDPLRETVLWPGGWSEVYETLDRIFDCRGHGWANLQSAHLNLPFQGDEEFRSLHAAVRIVLALLPALAASTPLVEGRSSGFLDHRLEVYRSNCRRVPSVTGRVIPETARSRHEYEERILHRIYRDMTELDPAGILRYEWINARGAIARFDRGTIEIRVLDLQECPAADLALLGFAAAVTRELASGRWATLEDQEAVEVGDLQAVLLQSLRTGTDTLLEGNSLIELFHEEARGIATLGDLLWMILEHCSERRDSWWKPAIIDILQHGNLARRILRAVPRPIALDGIRETYRELADCLRDARRFQP